MPISAPTSHLSLVIAPAEINLRVFVNGVTPVSYQTPDSNKDRTANGILVTGGSPEFLDFDAAFTLNLSDFSKLKAHYSGKLEQRRRGLSFETVIYNLAEPFSEIASAPTRRMVPSTSLLKDDSIGSLRHLQYWVALQGIYDIEWEINNDLAFVKFEFTEGTKLLPL